jgi:hypothetical protein
MPMLEIHPTIPYYYSESPSFAPVDGSRWSTSGSFKPGNTFLAVAALAMDGWMREATAGHLQRLRPHPQAV